MLYALVYLRSCKMGIGEIILTAFALAMDAFSVAICNGLSAKKSTLKQAAATAIFFGGFQALMPLLGFYIGKQFEDIITPIDHWIIFFLLAFIGVKMIMESSSCEVESNAFPLKNLFSLAVATSLDALAVGISFAWLKVNIIVAVLFIGVITLVLSFLGVKIGTYLGSKFKTCSERIGGVVLILIGLKILLEHLGVLPF